jgi:hypothetical protein
MKISIGAYVFASFVLLTAVGFVVTESRLFLFLRQVAPEKKSMRERDASPSRVTLYFVILFGLSALSFPATTYSLKASFAVPWQLLWPAAVLFLVSGAVGFIVGASLLVTPRYRVVAFIIATIVVLALSFRTLDFLFVPYR